ncbi:MAG: ParB/RepB/Spo0J family partition protein [candidate division WOR-3 bacterium]|nr:ParB/RepB/Spo0J family partition protein [candidate division WOR-3 bacterium]
MSKQALGKGINALISQSITKPAAEVDQIQHLSIAKIRPNPYQPRKQPQEDLSDLVQSIKEHGVLQPIIVRTRKEVNTDVGNYELVVGERRLRAAQAAGLTEIPAIIKDTTDIEMVEWALIENIQRADLNIIEQAMAYKKLMEDFSMTHEMIAEKVGKDRSTITNTLRLLTLPDKIQHYLALGKITAGHARALLTVADSNKQIEICERIILDGLSVRETERLCSSIVGGKIQKGKFKRKTVEKDVHLIALEEQLQEYLRTKVRITKSAQHGTVTIEFYSDDDLTRLVKLIVKK